MDYFEILFHKKYGSSVPIDGKFYEALFAVAGEWEETTIVGVPPIIFFAKGDLLSDYLISGNTVQNGTPTPEAPVDVVGCGVRTENLFYKELSGMSIDTNGKIMVNTDFDLAVARVTAGETYSVTGCSKIMAFYVNEPVLGSRSYNNVREDIVSPVTIPQGVNYVAYRIAYGHNNAMFNAGATPIPYEPYGMYKLPISCGGVTSNIYLGTVPTTRRIKKIVLTGEENWSGSAKFRIGLSGQIGTIAPICTHYQGATTAWYGDLADGKVTVNGGINLTLAIFDETNQTSIEDWKSYLAAQYAAGTPVTVWYVLAEPETGIVNEPLMKNGDYADTISMAQAGVTIPTVSGTNTLLVDTTVQPSSVSITGNIKEVYST